VAVTTPPWPFLIVVLTLLVAAQAGAHGTPVELAIWGAFRVPGAPHCQRVITSAAAACGLRAWRAQRDCAVQRWRGETCDPSAVEEAIEEARRDARASIAGACNESMVMELQFNGVAEAQLDVARFCRELEDAAVSLILDPVADPASPAASVCAEAAGRATTKLLNTGFRSRQRLFGRIAGAPFSLPAKRELVTASTAEIDSATDRLAEILAQSCPPDEFVALYGLQSTEALTLIASRADCLAGDTAVQDAVQCPPSQCGNRLRERDEECDDGNAVGGDGCSMACRREAPGLG
jgi:cysteine-rich repeat protein